MLGGFIGDAPMLCVGKLMGLLGPWLCFHGVEPPFPLPFLLVGPMAVEPTCLVVSLATPVHADGVSFTQCYAWAS